MFSHKLLYKGLFFCLLVGMALLTTVFVSAQEENAVAPPTDVVVRWYYDDYSAEIAPLMDTYDVWTHGSHGKGFTYVRMSADQYNQLKTTAENIELDVSQTNAHQLNREVEAARGGGIPGFSCYRTVEETISSIVSLETTYPDFVEILDIGDSWDKVTPGGSAGYDIVTIVVTNENAVVPTPKPKLFIMAATHAREYTTAETSTRFIEHLLAEYGTDPDITWMLDYFEVHMVPQANPDGRKVAEQADIWQRKNMNANHCSNGTIGVDLNRNMSYEWNGGGFGASSGNQCSEVYRGTSGGSEPENSALESYITSIYPDNRADGVNSPADLDTDGIFLTIHSSGGYVLPVWGYTSANTGNTPDLYTLGRKMGYYNDYEVCGTGTCFSAADGTHDDYAYGEFGVPAYTFELGTQFHQSCNSFENTIYPDNLDALLYTLKATRRPYQRPAGPEVVNLTAAGGRTGSITVTAGDIVSLSAAADDTRYDSNGYGNEATQNIQAARYTVDKPEWDGGVPVAMTALDGNFNANVEGIAVDVDTTGWSEGQHIVFVEAQDADGNWGVPSAFFIEIDGVPSAIELGELSAETNPTTIILAVTIMAFVASVLVWRFHFADESKQ